METLDNKWMKLKTCDNTDSQPATLGLENMAGLYALFIKYKHGHLLEKN